MTSITLENGQLVVFAKYHPGLVANIKAIPQTDRRWDPNRKVWKVDPSFASQLKGWILDYLGEDISLPTFSMPKTSVRKTDIFRVRYIGACKMREDGSVSALGLVDNDWKLLFPEAVLRQWFDAGPAVPGQKESLYSILGAQHLATLEEIKTAYRRMARQWHPDVCREVNANEVFLRIQEAYAVLSDPIQRAKYNAGLKLQASMGQVRSSTFIEQTYRSPLRCGFLMVEGIQRLNRFAVEKILDWEDIVDPAGRVLVTSWAMGMKEPTEVWS